MAVTRLLVSELKHRKTRSALTIGAVSIAVSLVVAMTSGFASLRATAYRVMGTYYGDVDVKIEPREEAGRWFDEAFVDSLRADPRVNFVRAQLNSRAVNISSASGARRGGPVQLVGFKPSELPIEQRRPLRAGSWFGDGDADHIVLDETIIRWLRINPPGVGAEVVLPTPSGASVLKVSGVTARPSVMNLSMPTVYLPIQTLAQIVDRPGQMNHLEIDLKPGQDVGAFARSVEQTQFPGNPPLIVKTVAAQRARFDRNFEALELLSYLGGTVSMIAAVFIIFSTLTMGVSERSRVLAMLRAIGAERPQIARLVLMEGLLLGLVGSLMGVALGYLWINLLVRKVELFTAGVVLSPGGIVYGVVGSVAAALLASVLPAYAASRVSPLDAMAIAARPRSSKGTWLCLLAGLVLLSIDPLIIYLGGIDREWRIILHFALGLPSFMLGLFAISPAVVVLIDGLLGPLMARVLLVQPSLLRQQLSGGLWRSAGTASALMVGLTILVLIRVHGHNIISAWQLPDRFPDLLVGSFVPVTPEQARPIEQIPGVAKGQVLPVAWASPQVGADIFSVAGLVQTPDATIVFGLDPALAFTADNPAGKPMVEIQFVDGDPARAFEGLRHGRTLLVGEEFRTLKGLGVGDTLELQTTRHGTVPYTIVGVVRSPGVDVLVRMFQMDKEFNHWTASGSVTSMENLTRDFGVERYQLFGVNLDAAAGPRKAVDASVKEELKRRGFLSASSIEIKRVIDFGLHRVLDLASSVALMAILVASIGVTNTILASVRSRTWQFGVLRSMGLTRGSLLRMVIAEAVLIALAACALGIGGGLLLSFDAGGMAALMVGMKPHFTVSPSPLLFGAGVTLAVAVAAGLWPALRTAFAAPLRLLQAGRASA